MGDTCWLTCPLIVLCILDMCLLGRASADGRVDVQYGVKVGRISVLWVDQACLGSGGVKQRGHRSRTVPILSSKYLATIPTDSRVCHCENVIIQRRIGNITVTRDESYEWR
jgi:hypothetical protein